MRVPSVAKPIKAPAPAGYIEDEADTFLWHEELKDYVKRQRAIDRKPCELTCCHLGTM